MKNSIDKKGFVKIAKGAAIAGAGAIALYIVQALASLEISDPIFASFIAWFVPTATNAIKEFIRE